MEKLKILFLCPQPLWPVNTGARLRNFHLANALGADADITVLQITAAGESAPPQTSGAFHKLLSASRGKSYTPAKMLRGLAGPLPITVLNYTSDNVARTLASELEAESYDAVQLESIHLFRYFETIQRCRRPPRVVLDWHNIESELMQRFADSCRHPAKKLVAARTARLLHRLEDTALSNFAAHTVVSDREREKLVARAPSANIHVIANGVDSAAFAKSTTTTEPVNPARQTLLYVGSMDYHANSDAVLWFCREIWPQLSASLPTLDFKIVGRNPPPTVQALASDRIIVTGTVDDVRPFYHQAFAVLVPLRVGGGTRLKILEAMAAGVPVISSRLGAEGIDVTDRHNILLADTAADMSAAVTALIRDCDLSARLCSAARTLVETKYDWRVLGAKLAAVYRGLIR